jgi:hypothetical protein
MEREFRIRPTGLIFYLTLIVTLALTKNGITIIKGTFSDPCQASNDISNTLISIAGLGLVIFTSDAIGYIFSSFATAIFNLFGGYSGLFKKCLSCNNLKKLISLYRDSEEEIGDIRPKDFKNRLKSIPLETLHVFFFWYREGHENPLDKWVIRRFTAFFTAASSILAIIISQALAASIVLAFNWKLQLANCIWFFVLLLTIIAFVINGRDAIKRAMEAIDLWIANSTNPRFLSVLHKAHPVEKKSIRILNTGTGQRLRRSKLKRRVRN